MSLEQAFESRGYRRGGILFLRPTEAAELIAAARFEGIRILGVDGFFLTGAGTQPSKEHSVDLSRRDVPTDSWAAATQFIRRWPKVDLWFEVVLDE